MRRWFAGRRRAGEPTRGVTADPNRFKRLPRPVAPTEMRAELRVVDRDSAGGVGWANRPDNHLCIGPDDLL